MVARKPGETLDEMFSRLIAAVDGIRPEEVTVEYIHNQREEKIYPNAPVLWFRPSAPFSVWG